MPGILKAPFPWFGGKSRAAHLVWQRFGDAPNYVEPFFGSGAVLLSRPTAPGIETVNDLDCFLANFWRALQADPEAVAHYADWPVNEADLQARHLWLVRRQSFRERIKAEPGFYDAKIAGWWVWGCSCWIAGGWCARKRPWRRIPTIGDGGKGVHCKRAILHHWGKGIHQSAFHNERRGVHRKSPAIGNAGRGVHRKRHHLSNGGQGIHAKNFLLDYFADLAARLRRVRVCCGDWSRICGPSPTIHNGLTAVFLDPPYSAAAGRDNDLYNEESLTAAQEAAKWAIAHGDDVKMRIALCGYEGEHQMPRSWECVAWKANGGYSVNKKNRFRERIWFSPHCLRPSL